MRKKWTRGRLGLIAAKASAGEVSAQDLLGALYACGELGYVDYRRAVKWYRKAAEAGGRGAQYDLGLMYIHGEGVRKDLTTGLAWLKLSAKNGSIDAEELLGQIYENGAFGVRKNSRIAIRWYEAAVAHGNDKAKFSLGLLLLSKGGPQEKRRGLKLIRDAAKEGVAGAKEFLQGKQSK